MKRNDGQKGFTLIELMIVIGIVAILVALAVPSYTKYVLKANRGEAQQLLLNWANNQEIWRANDTDYATSAELTPPTHDRFDFYARATAAEPPGAGDCANAAPTATAYVLVACAKGAQVNDKERTQSCARMSVNQSNGKFDSNCWR